MIFYDKRENEILDKLSIIGYSFTISWNNMSLLSIPSEYRKKKDNEDKLLICGCKKYAKGKNGFLFLKIEIDSDGDIQNIHKEFYSL